MHIRAAPDCMPKRAAVGRYNYLKLARFLHVRWLSSKSTRCVGEIRKRFRSSIVFSALCPNVLAKDIYHAHVQNWTQTDSVLENILADSTCLWRRSLIMFRTSDWHMSSTDTVPSTSFSYTSGASSRSGVSITSSDRWSGDIVATSALSLQFICQVGLAEEPPAVSVVQVKPSHVRYNQGSSSPHVSHPNVERFVSDHSLKARSGLSWELFTIRRWLLGRHHGVVHA